MTKFEKQLRTEMRKLGVQKSDRILVAVSGGADSTALLDALTRWKGILCVAHLNHQLRGEESNADEAFVCSLAQTFQIKIITERIEISAAAEGKNLEAVARNIRYDFLLKAAQASNAKFIFTGHSRDDQVETLLMRLLRGTGAAGLHGIHQTRNLSEEIMLIRPMLNISRTEILAHCEHYNLAFRSDSSNHSLDFTRNRIRHELIPQLNKYNPLFGETFVHTAEQITTDDDYLQADVGKIFPDLVRENALIIAPLITLPTALRRRVIREWLKQNRGDLRRIGFVHILSIESLALEGEGNRYVELPDGWKVLRSGKVLKLE
jgi:tRNA(Ile)-lysidine synthase